MKLILWIVLNKFGDFVEFRDLKIFCNNLPLVYPQGFHFLIAVENYQKLFLEC